MSACPPTALPLLALLLSLAPACKGGDGDDGPTDDSDPPVETSCTEDAECDPWEICSEDACVDGDRNNAVGEAEAILWETGVTGYVQTVGDQDYFSFTAEGGEFIRVTTEPKGDEDLNTLVSLFSPAGKLHAREDEHPAGDVNTYDTVLYAYLPTAGTWTLMVEDLNGAADSDFTYTLTLQEYGGATDESDSFDDPSYDRDPLETGYIYGVGFVLDEEGDTDWMEFDLPYDDCPLTFYGLDFMSGSDAEVLLEVYLPDGTRLLSKGGLGPDGDAQYFEVDGQRIVVGVGDVDGGGGDNAWGFIFVQPADRGYGYEHEEEPNNAADEANALDITWTTNDSGMLGSALAWGIMDEEEDEDWFSVEVDDGYYLSILGTADSVGSLFDGVVAVYDQDGELVAEATSGDDEFPDAYNLGPLDGGLYTVQVLNEDAEGWGLDRYYRVAIYQHDYTVSTE